MKTKINIALLLGVASLIFLSAFSPYLQESAPTAFDLIVAVNAYRASKGYYALNPHNLVSAAAQAHAEWIVATGQGGHIGLNGSNETQRVSWTGYGGGASIKCDESWASTRTVEDAVYNAWSDWTHQEVMLNAWGNRYTDIGAGVAAMGNGTYVFVLNVCMVVGQGSSAAVPGATANPLATTDFSNYVYGVSLATPQADGTLKHKVLYGQTLASIAKAYDITIETLRALNNMAADATIIWPEQELLIQKSSGTLTPQPSATPPADISPTPVETALTSTQPPSATPTAVISPTKTPAKPLSSTQTTQLVGLLLVGLSVAGLIIIFISVFFRK